MVEIGMTLEQLDNGRIIVRLNNGLSPHDVSKHLREYLNSRGEIIIGERGDVEIPSHFLKEAGRNFQDIALELGEAFDCRCRLDL